MNYVDLQVRPPKKQVKGTKHREAFRLCAYCRKMQTLNWADQDGKPGIAQGYAQGNIYTVFSIKGFRVLDDKTARHVDS